MVEKQVLVVDDEAEIREIWKRALTACDWRAIALSSAETALAYLNLPEGGRVVGVITDVNMPGMGGFLFVRTLKNKFPQLKVAVMSGRIGNEREAILAGADIFIPKPIILSEIIPRLKNLFFDA